MSTKNRVDTVRLLISTHPTLKTSAKLADIVGELNRVTNSAKTPKHKGWLLKLLHTTRALDTTLREVLTHKGWANSQMYSLGSYLRSFRDNNVISHAEVLAWTNSIVNPRNKFMHSAGAMPNQLESDSVLSEMESCLTVILANT
ncbi:hypothetical protein [Microbacterium sp. Clip185]|uniref:hypothetical protein n=1 Tax=Microbacterium sp. Clip185 TaxID=3025663 RepID=UPI0023655734|nr:hypothetical protein [Microbacterium sp. Clip185]WDG18181.1 hypothetical protein PQV94_00240 [Microbacterium sp. Clip185]